MMYLQCAKVVDKISDIMDGHASILVRMRFHGHLLLCKNCRRYYDQLRTVRTLSGQVKSVDLLTELPDDFGQVMDFVMAEIEPEIEPEKGEKDA
ncbi:MAG: hypothetical protein JKY45_05925 [Emcibacter sp.]|nr:hypothetical protein [Emcibacter sp.]